MKEEKRKRVVKGSYCTRCVHCLECDWDIDENLFVLCEFSRDYTHADSWGDQMCPFFKDKNA